MLQWFNSTAAAPWLHACFWLNLAFKIGKTLLPNATECCPLS